jgi:hypothetical protein
VRGDSCIDCNRLSAAIARRAHELAKAKLAGTNGHATPAQPPAEQPQGETTPAPPLPEAPASVNCHIMIEGRQVQITLRDTDENRLLGRLAALLRQYPLPETQPAQPEPQRLSGGLVCQARRADEAKPQGRPLLVVALDTRGLVQGQVTLTGAEDTLCPATFSLWPSRIAYKPLDTRHDYGPIER